MVYQQRGERNFHIFYNVLAGSSDAELSALGLQRDAMAYHYTRQGEAVRVEGMNDAEDFNAVKHGMKVVGFAEAELAQCFAVVAVVMHLGQLGFEADYNGSKVKGDLTRIVKLLGCDPKRLERALVARTVTARGDSVVVPLVPDMAAYARDALAKSLYDRLFTWLVRRLNDNIRNEQSTLVIGVLDIYGFEIFQTNSFEQLCMHRTSTSTP